MTTAFQSNAFQNNAFQIDSTPTPTPGRSGLGGDDVPREWRKSPHRGWDRKAWKERVKDGEDAIENTLRGVYAELTGEAAPASVLARVDAIVRPVAKKQPVGEDAPLKINWEAIANDRRRANALMRLWAEEQEMRAIDEDDEDVMLLALQ